MPEPPKLIEIIKGIFQDVILGFVACGVALVLTILAVYFALR